MKNTVQDGVFLSAFCEHGFSSIRAFQGKFHTIGSGAFVHTIGSGAFVHTIGSSMLAACDGFVIGWSGSG